MRKQELWISFIWNLVENRIHLGLDTSTPYTWNSVESRSHFGFGCLKGKYKPHTRGPELGTSTKGQKQKQALA